MSSVSADSLRQSKCVPCEGGVPTIGFAEASEYLQATPDWTLENSGKLIRRKIKCKGFSDALERIQRIGERAEEQQHHPDLHLTGYRNLTVELTTHAIGGLSKNDFVMAAKIDTLMPPSKD